MSLRLLKRGYLPALQLDLFIAHKWYNKNMATNNPRISKSGVTTTGRFPLYSNSPEVQDADPSLVRLVRGNSLSSLYLSLGNLTADDIDGNDSESVDIVGDESTGEGSSGDGFRSGVPSSSDISIVSNTVVYDAAGNPSVTLVFKVKNSSGETLKGMNAKVELV
jgi:hypothetical protein